MLERAQRGMHWQWRADRQISELVACRTKPFHTRAPPCSPDSVRNPCDQAAWAEFVVRYRPSILQWCRRWGLPESDAEDVTQAVLLKFSGSMKTFVYDPSRTFRGWLKTLAHHAWRDLVDQRCATRVISGDNSMQTLVETLEAQQRPGRAARRRIPTRTDGSCDEAGAAAGHSAGPGMRFSLPQSKDFPERAPPPG